MTTTAIPQWSAEFESRLEKDELANVRAAFCKG